MGFRLVLAALFVGVFVTSSATARPDGDLCAGVHCNDGNRCTDDSCDPATGQCVFTPTCNDGNACTDDTCNPQNGHCSHANDNTNSCSDGNACTSDVCVSGACVGTPSVDCNDGNACTDDACNPASGQCVVSNDDTNACSDANACTSEVCVSGACVATVSVVCDDGNVCTDDACDPVTGQCIYTNDDTNVCSEASGCITDACSNGSCVCSVPLRLWKNADFPFGLEFGGTMGVSWGDYDADGSIDLYSAFSGLLWRNIGGSTFAFAADLSELIPPAERRYGSSFGDYDNDGLPDLAIAPRVSPPGDDLFHLLHALGGGPNFVDVAGDPSIVDVQPHGNAETLCWADVDGDRNLDLFVPVYPGLGPGNFFLHNLGPTGPAGAYRLAESSESAGLDIPPGAARPEGAQFVDVDFDGDVDLFSNGTLYQNLSAPGLPLFLPLTASSSGVGLPGSLDEGAMFFDYDLDGDQDLVVAYAEEGVRIWENYGDGSFFEAEPAIVDGPLLGLDLGMSAEDWDNDGDIDFTTREVFRRNMLTEEHARHFTVENHSIPAQHIHSATPAWGDWDRDGDLDCAIGNWGDQGHVYENTLYTPATPAADRRYVRVRVVRGAPSVPRGLEVEYGATAEIRIVNGADDFRRRKFVASSHGYLNQNEYALHFGLPPKPAGSPDDLHFDLSVDFPGWPADGLWRVDKHVNPALGDIGLDTLADREIRVDRSGRVVVGGVAHDPLALASPRLITTTGGLGLPGVGPLPDPSPAPSASWYTGLAFDTTLATERVAVREIILDGQLAAPADCGSGEFNLALWDVTADPPVIVAGGAVSAETSARNRRSYLPVDILVEPGRSYRLTARVASYRTTAIAAPVTSDGVTVQGGLAFESAPCLASAVAAAPIDPGAVSIAIRFSPLAPGFCSSEFPAICDDGNPCTDDACGPAGACVHTNNVAACDDENACTGTDLCSAGLCTGVPSSCDDANPCTTDSCAPASGCAHVNNAAPCDDGSLCTTLDVCSAGQCIGLAALSCNDGNPCTDNSCNPATGCVFTQDDTNACSDGNSCTTADHCLAGSCVGTSISCDDGDTCTTDTCRPTYGCANTQFEVMDVGWVGKTTIGWSSRGSGAKYDLATGSLAALPTLGSGAGESCLVENQNTTSAQATQTPTPQAGFWYLVRARNNGCGLGTYGFQYPHGSPPVERIVAVCP